MFTNFFLLILFITNLNIQVMKTKKVKKEVKTKKVVDVKDLNKVTGGGAKGGFAVGGLTGQGFTDNGDGGGGF